MALIRRAWFADGLAGKKIDLGHARMELGNLREIHAERPHFFQRRVDDDFLPGSERCLQLFPLVLRFSHFWLDQIGQELGSRWSPGIGSQMVWCAFVVSAAFSEHGAIYEDFR